MDEMHPNDGLFSFRHLVYHVLLVWLFMSLLRFDCCCHPDSKRNGT